MLRQTTFLLLAIAMAATGTLCAQEAPATAAPAAPATEPVATAGYKLKNRSAYTLPAETRSPFWPLGWRKVAGVQNQETVYVKLDPNQFVVSAILLGPPSLAVINGKHYEEGEYLRMPRPQTAEAAAALAKMPRIRVARIVDGSVMLDSGGQQVMVPLRRAETLGGQRQQEELVPVQDR